MDIVLLFMCIFRKRTLNDATKMVRMLLSMCEEQRSAVQFLWTAGHNPSEIHMDMCGVYGEDYGP